jgi:ubiquinone/menaquinone biosynthesis C-methylase UbiE
MKYLRKLLFFDVHVCPWWAGYMFDNRLRRLFQKPEKILSPYLKEGMTAMDIGCGMGFFTIGMAGLVGENGSVTSVDVQRQMLDITQKRALRAGVADRIALRLCQPGDIGVREKVDFALAFWMLHEVPDQGRFLDQVFAILNPAGKLLVAEPRMHISAARFNESTELVKGTGFIPLGLLPIRLSRAMLFEKPS